MTLRQKRTDFDESEINPIINPHARQTEEKKPFPVTKRYIWVSLAKPTDFRLFKFYDENGYLNHREGLDKALTLTNKLTKLVLVIKTIFDTTTREKEHKFLEWGYKKLMTKQQQNLFRFGAKKIKIDKREDRKRNRITPTNKKNLEIPFLVHKRLKGYRQSHNLESLSHVVDTALDTICDLRELILVLKEIFMTAKTREDYREILYGFNNLMTFELRILYNQILRDEKNAK